MQQFQCVVFLALLAGAAAAEAVTPVEKVLNLIDGLKSEVETEGRSEARAYNKFACFCKRTTGQKSTSVKRGTDKIGRLSANIGDKTQSQKDDSTELAGRKQDHEELNTKLDDTTSRCTKQKATYDAEAADMSKAIQGLKDAIKAMKDSKTGFVQVSKTLSKTFEMAEAMNLLSTQKHKAVAAFVQQSSSVDPSDPEYKFHSNDIVDVCEELLVDYKASKKSLDDEWGKTKKACEETKRSLNKQLNANDAAMNQLDKSISRLKREIAKHRENLVVSDGMLKDDEQYLKDLTARCEDRANDYDQRSAMRNDELTALTTALSVLRKSVKKADATANVRAFLQEATAVPAAPKPLPATSFLQTLSSSDTVVSVTQEARRQTARDMLRSEGQRIGSLALTSLSEHVAGDPFKKIKGLIQKLIERLLTEAKNEATKKGFCDTELGKARTDRDFRWQDSKDLNADLVGLEATRDSLEQEIKELKADIILESQVLKDTTQERKDDNKVNMETLRVAKGGLEGVNEALLILRSFYKQAAKASFLQASPVDEDTAGAGFKGNYGGKQGGMQAVFALLETIVSDFERTLKKTEESEAAAHREYVAFSQAAEASIAGKKTKQDLDEQDLKTTKATQATKMDDLQTAVDLLDSAFETLEELKPTCIDTGMSYSERVKKREEEMKALGKALCILDEDNVEAECKPR